MPESGVRNARHDAIMTLNARSRAAAERIIQQAQARTTQPNQRGSPEGPSGPQRHPANVRDTPTAAARGSRKRRKGR